MLGLALAACLCIRLSAALPYYYMDQHCGSTISLKAQRTHSVSLVLTSEKEYGSNMNCYVTVTADAGSRIMTSFVWLDVNSFAHCPGDYVQIMDSEDVVGNNTSSRNWTSTPVCGRQKPDVIMTSRSNSVTIRFISDGHFFGQGFQLVLTQFHYGPCNGSEFRCDNRRCVHADLLCSSSSSTTTTTTNTTNSNNTSADDNFFDHCGDLSYRRRCTEDRSSSLQIIVCVTVATVVVVLAVFILAVVGWNRRKHQYREEDEEDGGIPGREDESYDAGSVCQDNLRRSGERDSTRTLIYALSSFTSYLGTAGATLSQGFNVGLFSARATTMYSSNELHGSV